MSEILCRLNRGAGTTVRRAIETTVEGRALLGPATFPSTRPETHGRERARWTTKGWVIVTPKKQEKRHG